MNNPQMKEKTASSAWLKLISDVSQRGTVASPRNLDTIECLAYRTDFDMAFPIVLAPLRKLSFNFMYDEALWVLTGQRDLGFISRHAPRMKDFSDNGRELQGAYGPMYLEQINYVASVLHADPDTRQAVMVIWRQNPRISLDIPCTIALQWLIRDKRLFCIATMRSSDIWLGWPYDAFTFSMMSYHIALRLPKNYVKEVANICMQLGSAHLYAKNHEQVKNLLINHADSFNRIQELKFRPPNKTTYKLDDFIDDADLINHLKKGPYEQNNDNSDILKDGASDGRAQ